MTTTPELAAFLDRVEAKRADHEPLNPVESHELIRLAHEYEALLNAAPAPTPPPTGELSARVARLLELEAKATPGPWFNVPMFDSEEEPGDVAIGQIWMVCEHGKDDPQTSVANLLKRADADFIAEVRALVLPLARALVAEQGRSAELQAENDALEMALLAHEKAVRPSVLPPLEEMLKAERQALPPAPPASPGAGKEGE